MNKRKYPIPGKEANDFDTAQENLYQTCVELASVSPLAFAKAVDSYIIHCCGLIHNLDYGEEFVSPGVYFDQVASIIRSQELDIRDRFTVHSKIVANEFGIKADTVEMDGDGCDF